MRALLLPAALAALVLACKKSPPSNGAEVPDVVLPDAASAVFVEGVDNPLLPFPTGATWTYEADDGDESVRIDVVVEKGTREVNGVAATVVRDTETAGGDVAEDTRDWYAQDAEGNVWYLGEDTCEYEGGECVSRAGSWEWGVDGALPGIVMPAEPATGGKPYYQEHYEGHAEDYGEVVATGVAVSVPAGSFDGCVKIHESSTIETDMSEDKYYCPGVGQVLTEEGDEKEELTAYSGL